MTSRSKYGLHFKRMPPHPYRRKYRVYSPDWESLGIVVSTEPDRWFVLGLPFDHRGHSSRDEAAVLLLQKDEVPDGR